MSREIIKTHIENDVANNEPKLVFTDQYGTEWVLSHQSMSNDGGGVSNLVKKSDCWYFKPKK